MKISSTQQTDLGKEYFIAKAIEHLRKNHEAFNVLDYEDARIFVMDAFDKATKYELVSEQAVMTFVIVAWTLGLNFTTKYTEANHLLRNPYKTDEERSFDLYNWTYQIIGK